MTKDQIDHVVQVAGGLDKLTTIMPTSGKIFGLTRYNVTRDDVLNMFVMEDRVAQNHPTDTGSTYYVPYDQIEMIGIPRQAAG